MKNINLKVKRYIKACSIYLLLCCPLSVYSVNDVESASGIDVGQQARKITGTIIDFETQSPVIGASILVVGKKLGTISDFDGHFTIQIDSDDAKLEVSFLGYEKQVITVGKSETLSIILKEDSKLLDEIVVVGYGTTTRRDLTGSVSKPDMKDVRKAPVTNFEEALAGRVAGVQVTSNDGQPGSDMLIVIRGNNSVTQNNSPLYVIDGFPMEASMGNALNSEEIESIEVLKDASATAIYGARGANGVILVTTKKGKVGAPVVTYSGWLGVHQLAKTQDLLGPYDFVAYQLDQDYDRYSAIYLKDGKTLEDYRNVKGIDWQDLVFRDSFVHNHNVALRGGSEKTRYSFSGSASNQEGVIINSGFEKYQGRGVFNQIINDKVEVGLNLNYTATKKYGTIVSESQTSPTASLMYSIWGFRPITGRDDDNLANELFDEEVSPVNDLRINPLKAAQNEFNPMHTYNFTANAYLQYKVLKNLTLRISGGYNKIDQKHEVFFNSSSRLGHKYRNEGVNGSIKNTATINYLNENTLTYDVGLKKGHKLKVLGGFTLQDSQYSSEFLRAIQVPNESLGIAGLGEGKLTSMPISRQGNALMSYLGRIDYNYKSRYLLTGSFRADGSSKFSKKNRWAYFPSVATAWGFGEESFMKSLDFLSSGKVRAGIGATGNNRVDDFASLMSLQILSASGYSTGNVAGLGMVPTSLGNPELKWETTVQTNVGIDLSFLNNRIRFSTEYYYKKTKDLLLNATMAPSMGFLSAYKNVGKVSNSGFEFTLDTSNIETKDFSWSSSFNISFNRNKVLALNEDEPSLASRVTWGNFNNAYPYIAVPGHPIAMFYGHIFDGVYQYDDFNEANGIYTLKDQIPNNGIERSKIQPGDIKFRDINDDGIVNDKDLTVIGNPNPKHIGGFGNNFRYKDFDLNVFLQWSYGGDVLNANRIEFEGGDPNTRNFLNMFSSFKDRWTPENQTNKLYRVGGQGPAVYSSRTIEDGSFLRLKTISLGYNLPNSLLKHINIKSLRIYASAQNLITWSNYSGLDPEVSARHSALTPSFDWSAYPRPRIFTFGLDLTF